MTTGCLRGGHWTPCDLYLFIRKCDYNVLKKSTFDFLIGKFLFNFSNKFFLAHR